MSNKISSILEKETAGKSYRAHKYCLDHAERPEIDYRENDIIWEKTAENPKPKTKYISLHELCQDLSTEESLLTYFLDGSRRVFKVDDIAYGNQIYPIMAGQIGIGCCKRVNKKIIPEVIHREFVLSIPDIANFDRRNGYFIDLLNEVNKSRALNNIGIEFSKIIPYDSGKKNDQSFEDLGTACIQDRMIEQEKQLVADLVRKRKISQNEYLIKDGSLEYRTTSLLKNNENETKRFLNNYNWVVGVSKNFNPEVCHDKNGKTSPQYIAELPLFHRTPVAHYHKQDLFGNVHYAVWYVRIRDGRLSRTRFDGVLKVEKMLVTEEERTNGLESDMVNRISAYIINERNPVCFGSDLRWANHLYPIYLTESYIKSKYLSTESFLSLF